MPFTRPPYAHLRASLLTQHGKEKVICPEMLETCHLEVLHVTGYDTDQLGTFTRDVARKGSQLDAARAKARKGMALSGAEIGIASEGSFTNDPFTGLLPWNLELILLIDDKRKIEIFGFSGAAAQNSGKKISSWQELESFAAEAQFPSHHLVLRPDHEGDHDFFKGINSLEALKDAYNWAVKRSKTNRIHVENDLRAHANPTRMSNILKATKDLSKKMNSLCPQCPSPGFWISGIKKGLPCSACHAATELPLAHIWSCLQCDHQNIEDIKTQITADPSKCNYCNP